jgi:hypothetical protein
MPLAAVVLLVLCSPKLARNVCSSRSRTSVQARLPRNLQHDAAVLATGRRRIRLRAAGAAGCPQTGFATTDILSNRFQTALQRQICGRRIVQSDVPTDEQRFGGQVAVLDKIRANLIIQANDECLTGIRVSHIVDLVAIPKITSREPGFQSETFAQGNLPNDIFERPPGNKRIVKKA